MFSVYLINHTEVNDLFLKNQSNSNIFFSGEEEQTTGDHSNYPRTKNNNNNNNNDYHYHQQQQRRYDHNNGYRSSPPQHQGQSSSSNTYHDRTFFNRGRTGVYEQLILIRSPYVPRIVGKFEFISFSLTDIDLFRYTRFEFKTYSNKMSFT